jgi:hypothetical protein
MDFGYWRRRLEAQRGGEVAWECSNGSPERRAAVARLLRAYAGSEGAEREIAGALLQGAGDEDDRAALGALLDDERRHAEILLEAARRLDPVAPPPPSPSRRIGRLIGLMRPLGFLDTLVVFHLFEIAAVAVYRLVRATNRRDRLVRGALGLILRDEAAHTAFHEERLVEALRAAGPLRRLRMRAVHTLAARLVVLNDRSVAPREVYPAATAMAFDEFNGRVIRAFERAYSGRLRALRAGD